MITLSTTMRRSEQPQRLHATAMTTTSARRTKELDEFLKVLTASQDSSPQPEVLAPTVDEVPTPQGFLLHLGKILMSFF